tara:strand:+ start:8952 stop:10493 length:1542 start_codon:yes stop_codon:yes gene_type:complete
MSIYVDAETPRRQFTVTSPTTEFSFDFNFFQDSDIKVYVDSTLKSLTTHYTVTGEGNDTASNHGGTVTFGSAVDDVTVTIIRDIAIQRTTDFPASGAFQVDSLNTELDTITAVQQELEDDISRTLRLDAEDATVAMELPLKAARLGKILGFNSSTGVPEMYVYLTNENTVALDGLTAGTVTESKYVLVDANKDIGSFRNVTLTGELDAGSLDVSGNADIDGTLEADAITVDGTALNEYIADTVGAMVGSNTETGVTVTYEDSDNTLDFVLGTTHTTVTSLTNASLVVGRDADNQIKFGTDNEITFRVSAGDGVVFKASGEIEATSLDISGDADIDGTLEADAITVDGTALNEYIADTVGAMVGSNTETGISVTYEDGDNTLDFVIGAGSIVNSMLADDAVGADELASNAVVTASIVDDNVTQAKIADDAVGADQLASDAVVNASIASGASVAFSKMENLTASRALVSDGNGDVSVATTTSTEIGYVNGLTSAIQTQLDAKASQGFAIAMSICL